MNEWNEWSGYLFDVWLNMNFNFWSCFWLCFISGVCILPKKTGPCRGAMPRYFYNPLKGECELFTFGGCGSNGNNFRTKQHCEASCGGKLVWFFIFYFFFYFFIFVAWHHTSGSISNYFHISIFFSMYKKNVLIYYISVEII